MSDEAIMEELFSLSCELSPENLHCDGEISQAAANRKYRKIMKRWHELEAEIGHDVSEDEVWKWYLDRRGF